MKVVNPKHDDVFREEIGNFLERISRIIKVKLKDSNIDIEKILHDSGRFSSLNKIECDEMENPFSDELLIYVKNEMIIPLLNKNFENVNLGNKIENQIIQHALNLFIKQAKDIIDKYPHVNITDIEINIEQ